jgi:YHS domain-containing protein
MARLILLIILFLILYAILRILIKGISMGRKKLDKESQPEELVQDPCCQTYVPKRTAHRKRMEGRDYYFCSHECLKKFLEGHKSSD